MQSQIEPSDKTRTRHDTTRIRVRVVLGRSFRVSCRVRVKSSCIVSCSCRVRQRFSCSCRFRVQSSCIVSCTVNGFVYGLLLILYNTCGEQVIV